MISFIPEFSTALFSAILHSIWQGGLLALVFYIGSRFTKTSQARYLLALTLFSLAPVAFVVTFLGAFSTSPVVVDPSVYYSVPVQPVALAIAFVWCIGASLIGGRFFLAWVWLRLFILRSAREVPPSVQAVFDASKRALAIPDRVVVRSSHLIQSPMMTGVIAPVVLLPMYMTSGVPANVLKAVFAHELSHVRRYDHVAVFIQAVGETLLFFHPAVKWLSDETRKAREYRCDDDSVQLLGDKFEYARALLMLEQSRSEHTTPALMMSGGDLMNRVEKILVDKARPKSGRFNFTGMAVFICAVFLTHSINAQTEPDREDAALKNSVYALNIAWLPPAVTQWAGIIEVAAEQHSISPDLLALMLLRESGGNTYAKSSGGARGLMQVMPKTGAYIAEQRGIEGFSAEQLYDPQVNVDFGAWYLASQLAKFSQDGEASVALAVAAYNAGPGAVRSYLAGNSELPAETVRYRDMIMAMLAEKEDARSATIDKYMTNMRTRLPAFTAPVNGRLTSTFGEDGGKGVTHHGVDIVAAMGTIVSAPVQGTVAAVGEDEARGKFVTVRHAAGVESHYFHLSAVTVEPGARVSAGDSLGKVGSTGRSKKPHLHFEIREFGEPVSPALYGLFSG